MSRKTIITGALVAIVALALLSSVALAGRGSGSGSGMAGRMDRSSCRMNERGMRPSFTSEQTEEMKEIRAGFEKERVELANRLKVLHLEMKDVVEAENPDFGKIEGMIDDAAEMQAQMMKLRLKQHRAIRAILDDDQRVLFDRGIARMLDHGGRGGMRGNMGGKMDCGPMGGPGNMMSGPGCTMGGPGAMRGGPMSADKCVIMMKGDPGEMDGRVMRWQTDDGEEVIEIIKVPGGGDVERRVIIEKIEGE